MKSEKFESKESKVGGTTCVSMNTAEMDSRYKIHLYPDNPADGNGLIRVASLVSNDDDLPAFEFRWDHKKEVVDVDLLEKGERQKRWEKIGYKGHHLVRIPGNDREFAADIRLPGVVVFKGSLKVGVRFEDTVVESLNITDQNDATVI